ncbi:hypothetical protein LRS74_01290 [Streptomyces sp. LX-29]|uniref:hypothetical protein n=1 Tax=Streptomyces sp. LX-29 TaxID=2900152 RepID=UPI00240DB48A|nr:hypothetical protein [Streptomyces sp. LX-29]WFB05804.1 hypothetical protein LRS74_01290 [Streptomyces sp. LX-29]
MAAIAVIALSGVTGCDGGKKRRSGGSGDDFAASGGLGNPDGVSGGGGQTAGATTGGTTTDGTTTGGTTTGGVATTPPTGPLSTTPAKDDIAITACDFDFAGDRSSATITITNGNSRGQASYDGTVEIVDGNGQSLDGLLFDVSGVPAGQSRTKSLSAEISIRPSSAPATFRCQLGQVWKAIAL